MYRRVEEMNQKCGKMDDIDGERESAGGGGGGEASSSEEENQLLSNGR